MAWVEFTGNFDWHPPEYGGRVTLVFQAGKRCNLRRVVAEAAIAAGKASPIGTPRRGADGEGGVEAAHGVRDPVEPVEVEAPVEAVAEAEDGAEAEIPPDQED